MKKTTLENIVVIANEASWELGAKVAVQLGTELTKVSKHYFVDGEIHHSFSTDLAGKDVIVIGSNYNDAAHQELIDLIDGSRCWNADSVNVVIPFLGYSTMERFKPDSGEIPKGITRTRQIFRARPDFVAFVDLHSEAVMHAHDAGISRIIGADTYPGVRNDGLLELYTVAPLLAETLYNHLTIT